MQHHPGGGVGRELRCTPPRGSDVRLLTRTALDNPPEAIALTLSNGAEYEGELLNLVLSGDTTYLHEKLVLLGGEYDRSLDQTLFTLNEDCTQAFVT